MTIVFAQVTSHLVKAALEDARHRSDLACAPQGRADYFESYMVSRQEHRRAANTSYDISLVHRCLHILHRIHSDSKNRDRLSACAAAMKGATCPHVAFPQ